MVLILKIPSGAFIEHPLTNTTNSSISSLYSLFNLPEDGTYFTSNGKTIPSDSSLFDYDECIIECKVRLNGGKGGFGSLLKGQPAVKKQTKNFDACRDISGRRLRHVNQEKQMVEWEKRKEEEERKIKKYNSATSESEIIQKLNADKNNEIAKQNEQFFIENNRTKRSIEKSLKFLSKKRKNENGKKLQNNNNNKENKHNNIKKQNKKKSNIKKPQNTNKPQTKEELLAEILAI
jgi:hypothetical protein